MLHTSGGIYRPRGSKPSKLSQKSARARIASHGARQHLKKFSGAYLCLKSIQIFFGVKKGDFFQKVKKSSASKHWIFLVMNFFVCLSVYFSAHNSSRITTGIVFFIFLFCAPWNLKYLKKIKQEIVFSFVSLTHRQKEHVFYTVCLFCILGLRTFPLIFLH